MDELIMNAARELGIEQYISISPYSSHGERTVFIAYEPDHVLRLELSLHDLMDESELKRILLQKSEEAKRMAMGVSAE